MKAIHHPARKYCFEESPKGRRSALPTAGKGGAQGKEGRYIMELTNAEQLAIELLKKAARHWPESLWIFAADGVLHVMKKDTEGRKRVSGTGTIDQSFGVASIDIETDGKGW